jgi:uncharacterized delta-60 repeat protein
MYLLLAAMIGFASVLGAAAADGNLDPTFGAGGVQIVQVAAQARDFAKAVAVQPDGKIIIGSELGDFGEGNTVVLIRLNQNGSLDTSFGNGGKVLNSGQNHVRKIVLQPDGKILVAGSTRPQQINFDFSVVRYNSNGTLDQSFGTNGVATSGDGEPQWLILQPDGRILLIGTLIIYRNGSDYLLARFNADGSPDLSFGSGGRVQTSFTVGRTGGDAALSAALQSDGRIVVTGNANCISPGLIRYNQDGTIDKTFGLNGTVLTPSFGAVASRIVIDGNDKILVGGGGFIVGRYEPNGTTDTTYGTDGRTFGGAGYTGATLYDMRLEWDGKLLMVGSVNVTSVSDTAIMAERFTTTGQLDPTFGNNGVVVTNITTALDESFGMAIYDNSRFLAVGYAAEPGATYVDTVATRYLVTPPSIAVSGRVSTPDGAGVRNATVTMADPQGVARNATTNAFGYYSFDRVASAAYHMTVRAKQFQFDPRDVITADSDMKDVDFVPKPAAIMPDKLAAARPIRPKEN